MMWPIQFCMHHWVGWLRTGEVARALQYSTSSNYLESFTKLVTHDVIQERIDARWDEEQNTWYIVDAEWQILVDSSMLNVGEDDSLDVKRAPAEEKRYDDHDCERETDEDKC